MGLEGEGGGFRAEERVNEGSYKSKKDGQIKKDEIKWEFQFNKSDRAFAHSPQLSGQSSEAIRKVRKIQITLCTLHACSATCGLHHDTCSLI